MKKIEELKKEVSRLKELVKKYKYDYLTGLKLRLDFEDRLKEVELEVNYHDGLYTIVMIDLDNLHTINRTEGFEYGDKILKRLAVYLCDIFDPSDVYRIGGDEFYVIVKGKIDDSICERFSKIPIGITYAKVEVNQGDNDEHIFVDDVKKQLDNKIILKKNKLKRRKNDR